MISHRHKCIFIHVPKCAGESIEYIITGKTNRGHVGDQYEGTPQKHMRPQQYINYHGQDMWNQYFTFTVVRNPWDRLISWIMYRDKRGRINPGVIDSNVVKRHVMHDFLKPCYTFLGLNKVSIDLIGRFENLQEDFNIICDKIGIPRKKLPHKNKTKHKHYTEYYDDETRELVANKYKKDIEYFGYEFGE